MLNRALRTIDRLGARRIFTALLAPAMAGLALDAWIAHFVSGTGTHRGQYIPVWFGSGAAVMLVSMIVIRLRSDHLMRVLRIVGQLAAGVGILGTILHLIPTLGDLATQPITIDAIESALSVAPPLFAPSAFAAVGGGLWLLGDPRFLRLLGVELRAELPPPIERPEPAVISRAAPADRPC